MTHLEALRELESITESGVLDAGKTVWMPEGYDEKGFTAERFLEAFNGSLDAARALHEAMLSGWAWVVSDVDAWVYIPTRGCPPLKEARANHDIPARAWLLAIIRALISIEEANNG